MKENPSIFISVKCQQRRLRCRHLSVVQMLLGSGCTAVLVGQEGQSCLHYAALNNRWQCISAVLESHFLRMQGQQQPSDNGQAVRCVSIL